MLSIPQERIKHLEFILYFLLPGTNARYETPCVRHYARTDTRIHICKSTIVVLAP